MIISELLINFPHLNFFFFFPFEVLPVPFLCYEFCSVFACYLNTEAWFEIKYSVWKPDGRAAYSRCSKGTKL